MAEIRIDYDNAKQQVKKLRQAADRCEDVIRDLKNTERDLPDTWMGQSADAYAEGLGRRIQEIQKIQNDTERLASLIEDTARKFKEAEERAKEAIEASFN